MSLHQTPAEVIVALLPCAPMEEECLEGAVRHDWSVAEIRGIHDLPLLELLHRAQTVHRAHHPKNQVQLCTLLSVKTGACPEDCAYCPQSARYNTHVEPERLMELGDVMASAQKAKAAGATRFCMGAAWREVKEGPQFDRVLEMVRGVRGLGLETCTTLGMLTPSQAHRLKEAGLDTYNHNIDTSREHYRSIVSTRDYDARLETLRNVRDAGIAVCSGGIIGMGESIDDRCRMLRELSSHDPHPESVPINALVPVPGTPLGEREPVDPLELVRMIATARILMPTARVRLSAGRQRLGREAQLLCLMAGANSIFYGEQLLTTPNPDTSFDRKLLADAGLTALEPSVVGSAVV
ncbi:MAG: biotin synthase BioB [Polyangiales bacterium]